MGHRENEKTLDGGRVTTPEVAEIADALNAANPVLDEDEQRLALTIYRLLAKGSPVGVDELTRSAGADPSWVADRLDRWTGVFRDDDGRVVAFWGLAVAQMDHVFEVDSTTLFTWCAWDPLFIAPMLGVPARVTSPCPVTGRTITLHVGPDGVRDVDPSEAVLSFLKPSPDMGDDVINSFCHYVRLFVSDDAAREWTSDHAGTFVLGLDDAFELGRMTLGRLAGRRS